MFPSLGNRLLELARMPHSVTVLTIQGGCDAQRLDFGDETFDAVLCATAPFSHAPNSRDMSSELKEWWRVTKSGGVVGFSGYGENAFQPLAALLEAHVQRLGIGLATPVRSSSWRLSDAEACRDLLHDAGFENIEVRAEQLGFKLKDASEWWDISCDSGLQRVLSQLAPEQARHVKAEHLAEVSALANANGIWLNVPAFFAIGRKSSGSDG